MQNPDGMNGVPQILKRQILARISLASSKLCTRMAARRRNATRGQTDGPRGEACQIMRSEMTNRQALSMPLTMRRRSTSCTRAAR